MNSVTRSTRPTLSLNSTQKKKNILSRILSSANKFLTGNKITKKNQSPPRMTREEEEEFVNKTFEDSRNKKLKHELGAYELMTPDQKEKMKRTYYTKEELKINNLNKRLKKLKSKSGGKKNKTKRIHR